MSIHRKEAENHAAPRILACVATPTFDDTSPSKPTIPVSIDAARPTPVQNIGRAVGSGMVLVIFMTIMVKLLAFVSQIVLGWKLSPEDFRLYASATAIAGFVMVCREAGVRELWVQRGPEGYERIAGAGFWLALTYNCIVAGIMAVVAWAIGRSGDPPLRNMLLVMAFALPLGTAGGLMLNKMRLQMNYKDMSVRMGVSGSSRQLSSIIFAYSGLGYMSLAWPVMVGAVVDTIAGYAATRDKMWARRPDLHVWPELLRNSKWLIFASVSNFALDWGPFAALWALGVANVLVIANETVGYFFFGFQITAQIGVMLSFNLLYVLAPAMQRLNDDPVRQGAAALRSLRALAIVGSISSLGLAAIMDPLEELIWRDKWDPAVNAVVILGIFFPWRVTFGLTGAIQTARGHFRSYAWLTLAEGLGFIICVVVAAAIEASAASMALGSGIWILVSRFVVTIWIFRALGVGAGAVAKATIPGWLASCIAGGLGIAFDRMVDVLPLAQRFASATGLSAGILHDVLRILCSGAICAFAFIAFCRIALRADLEDVRGVLPGKLRRPFELVMFLPRTTAAPKA